MNNRQYGAMTIRHEFCLPASRRYRLRYTDDYGRRSTGASTFVFVEKEYGRQVANDGMLCPDTRWTQLSSGRWYCPSPVTVRTFEVGWVCADSAAPTTQFPSTLPSFSTLAPRSSPAPAQRSVPPTPLPRDAQGDRVLPVQVLLYLQARGGVRAGGEEEYHAVRLALGVRAEARSRRQRM